jgi:hypothetical protein
MERGSDGYQGTVRCGIFDRPGFASVPAAREQVFLGLASVDVMTVRAEVLVIAGAESNQDFIAPRPKPVIGGPAPETPRHGVNLDVTENVAGWFIVSARPWGGMHRQRECTDEAEHQAALHR